MTDVTWAPSFADPEYDTLMDLVDLDRYPINSPKHPRRAMVVDRAREQLASQGRALLKGFLTPDAVAYAYGQMEEARFYAYWLDDSFDSGANLLPEKSECVDPPNHLGHLTRDQMPPHYVLSRVYQAAGTKRLLADCLGLDRLYESADPIASLTTTLVPPGSWIGWHYDAAPFSVTLMLREAESGGVFGFIPGLRKSRDDWMGLRRFLAGELDDRIVQSPTAAGDIQLFVGRYALHGVTPVVGSTTRVNGILTYAKEPHRIQKPDRVRKLYGRVAEAHLVAMQEGADLL